MRPEDEVPDLRVLAAGLVRLVQLHRPGLLPADSEDRIRSSINPMLVCLRVLASGLRASGITDEEIAVATAAAKVPKVPLVADAVKVLEPGGTAGQLGEFQAAMAVDRALMNPVKAARVPGWFKHAWWPDVQRRWAQGHPPGDRDIEIMLHVASIAEGER